MANGYQHAKATKRLGKNLTILSLLFCSFALLYGLTITVLLAIAGFIVGLWVGHFVTPDYDVDKGNYIKRNLINQFGFFGYLWSFYWQPYALLSPHRGTSHSWPLGTFVRFVTLLWPLIGIILYYQQFGLLWAFVGIFGGQSMQDFLHLWMDR